jgi:hypothetical protein
MLIWPVVTLLPFADLGSRPKVCGLGACSTAWRWAWVTTANGWVEASSSAQRARSSGRRTTGNWSVRVRSELVW